MTALLNLVSVLTAIATAALVGWLVGGWVAWLAGPLGASAVNGLEYALAEEEEEGG